LPLVRRVIGPSSVLSQRGKVAHYGLIADPQQIEGAGLDIVLLPDWVTDQPLPPIPGHYVYDCSCHAVLEHPLTQRLMGVVSAVTVPTAELATLARAYNRRVRVVPSLVHSDWLYAIAYDRPTRRL
jgi:hypothetical protein